jgi:peptidoglycan/LPS O-acetylase OafA/YrhL
MSHQEGPQVQEVAEIRIRSGEPSMRTAEARGHLPTLDALRGIAALSVCWFHYTNAQFAEQFGHYHASGAYGWLGVHIFFVISGFIIPFSMFRAGYRIRAFFQFMLKRIARLDPPYLASIVVVIVGYWLSSLLPGHTPYRVPWSQVFAHLGYLNAFIGMPWLQMSYWSLAIEFQYYIFVGLCFPLLAVPGRIGPAAVLAIAGLGSLAGKSEALLPHYLPLFAIGILAFRHRCLKARAYETFAALFIAFALAIWVDGWLQAGVALATALAILFLHVNNRVLNFFGTISYSVYLIHVFVGSVVFGLALRWAPRMPWINWTVQFAALGLAIGAAYLLYRLVELPSRHLAAQVSYKPTSGH